MASAQSASLWDQLVPDLRRHIHGLAVEQHCRELMNTQIGPSIMLAGLKRNHAAYEALTDWNEVEGAPAPDDPHNVSRWIKVLEMNFAFEEAFHAFHRSIAGLTRAERRLWMGRVRATVPSERLHEVFAAVRPRNWVENVKILCLPT
jgi:hypothetical protein